MKNLELIDLKWQNIGRFTDEQYINFAALEQLNQIDGMNHNTGGSSGAAKTTITKVLLWLWGVEKTTSNKLQSRLTKEKGWGESNFLWKGKPARIRRTRKPELEVYFEEGGVQKSITGNNKSAEEKIIEMMGIDPKVFPELLSKKQKSRGYFLNLTPKYKYELMLKLLGLESWKIKIDRADEELKAFIKDKAAKQLVIDIATPRIEEIDTELTEIEKTPPSFPNYDMELMRLEYDLTQVDGQISEKTKEWNDAMSLLVAPVAVTVQQDRTIFNKLQENMNILAPKIAHEKQEHLKHSNRLEEAYNKVKAQVDSIDYKNVQINTKGAEARNVHTEIEHLKTNSCPTCKREWNGEELQHRITDLSNKFSGLKAEIEALQLEIQEQGDVRDNLTKVDAMRQEHLRKPVKPWGELEKQWNQLNTEKALEEQRINSAEQDKTYLERLNQYNSQKREMEIKRDNALNVLKTQKHQWSIEETDLKGKKANASSITANYNQRIANLKEAKRKKEIEIQEYSNLLLEVQDEIDIAEEGVRVMKSFTIQKFKDALDTVAMYANDIIAGVPNTSNSNIYFDAFKLQADGKIKEEVTCYVSLDGEPGVPLDTLCGGEETAFELAIDLGFNEMVETMANIGFSHYFMDEPFDGMDDTCVTELVEMLKGCKTHKKLVIISHAPAIKELANKTIMVERRGETSNVTSIS